MGFKAGWIPGFPTWWRFRVHQELYMICRYAKFLLEGGRGWEGGMLWKWNCWCSCVVPLFHSSTQGIFFQHNMDASVTPKNQDLVPCLSLSICLWRVPFERTYHIYCIDPSIQLDPSIYIYLSMYPCIECIQGTPQMFGRTGWLQQESKTVSCLLSLPGSQVWPWWGRVFTVYVCVCVWHSCSARSFSFRLCNLFSGILIIVQQSRVFGGFK